MSLNCSASIWGRFLTLNKAREAYARTFSTKWAFWADFRGYLENVLRISLAALKSPTRDLQDQPLLFLAVCSCTFSYGMLPFGMEDFF
jgi:hypothetical protein